MAFVAQQFINGLALGSIYALMAIGLAVIFGILRLINFAHGELLMLGPFFAYALIKVGGLPFGIAAVLAVIGVAIVGILMERLAYRPLRGAPDVALLLTSLAVSIFLQNATILTFGGESKAFTVGGILDQRIQFAPGVGVSSIDVVIMAAALILL